MPLLGVHLGPVEADQPAVLLRQEEALRVEPRLAPCGRPGRAGSARPARGGGRRPRRSPPARPRRRCPAGRSAPDTPSGSTGSGSSRSVSERRICRSSRNIVSPRVWARCRAAGCPPCAQTRSRRPDCAEQLAAQRPAVAATAVPGVHDQLGGRRLHRIGVLQLPVRDELERALLPRARTPAHAARPRAARRATASRPCSDTAGCPSVRAARSISSRTASASSGASSSTTWILRPPGPSPVQRQSCVKRTTSCPAVADGPGAPRPRQPSPSRQPARNPLPPVALRALTICCRPLRQPARPPSSHEGNTCQRHRNGAAPSAD